jgi:hypothetical protein
MLCRSVIIEDIRISRNLDELTGTRERSQYVGWASWSIDWSSLDYWVEDRSRILTDSDQQVYHMSASHQPRLSTCISSNPDDEIGDKFMYATGRIIDQVIFASSPLDFSVGTYENVYHEYENVPELMEQSQILRSKETDGSYIAGGSPSNAFFLEKTDGRLSTLATRQS